VPLDPVLVPILEAINSAVPQQQDGLTVAEMRAQNHEMMDASFVAHGDDAPPIANVEDIGIPVADGEIIVRVYTPIGTGPFPAHLWIHGGGFWLGTIDQFDSACRAIANMAECVVASVDYRLAPEYKFPIPAEDCYATLEWLAREATQLNVDPTRISVGGASAGGNLSAVVALMARDRGGPPLVLQVLDIPVTDLTMSHPSITENGEGYLLTKEGCAQYVGFYLDDPTDATHPYASPFFADDLSDLPPALVTTAEFDPLRDEGEAYAERLRAAGVPVELHRMDGHIHGSMAFTKLMPSAVEHHRRTIAALRAANGMEER
jgi:acetyl esterase